MQRSFQPVMTTIVLTAAMLLACVPVSADVLVLDDGGIYNVDYVVTQEVVKVYNSTTVNLLDGGEIVELIYYDTSVGNIVGGENEFLILETTDDSMVNVSGGVWGMLSAHGNSVVNVSGGSQIPGGLFAGDDSTGDVTGGTIADTVNLGGNSETKIGRIV